MGRDHPARSDFDTLFVDHAGAPPGSTVLRTHTSPVQIRAMLAGEPPIYIVAPGRVFRRDTPDATHMPVFHQIEGLVVDRGHHASPTSPARSRRSPRRSSAATSRRGCVRATSRSPSRRASSTSAPRAATWLELGGCGMVHPNVLRAGGIDPEEWSGFAFGFGIDRMAKERHERRRPPRDVHRRHPLRGAVLMKILLSWLRDYVDTGDDVDALADTLADARARRRRRRPHGWRRRGRHRPRASAPRCRPDAAKVQRVWVDPATARAPRVVRRVQLRPRRHRARSPRSARRCPTDARSPGGRSSASTPRACSARPASSGSATTTPASWSCRADDCRRRAVRRGARPRRRTSCSTSTSPATAPTAGRTSAWPATSPPRRRVAASPSRRRSVAGRRALAGRRHRRRRPLRPVHRPPCSPGSRRPVGAVDGGAPDRGRHAPDQQRRRRLQLRDARARPAEPPVRPGDARRRRRSASAGPATASR